MYKYAGVTLDWFDDKGLTLKSKFPTQESLPDVIKTASVRPKEKIANEEFALIALDEGHVMRKYACYDPGTTAMSVIYFMEYGAKLPEDAIKLAATNLMNACAQHGLIPPEALTKVAGNTTEVEAVDITGQPSRTKLATSRPTSSADYAVITSDGKTLYPIHDWDHIKMAADYWEQENVRMEAPIRRQFAVKLAAKATELGFPLDGEIKTAGATHYAPPGHLKASLEMRKVAFPMESEERGFLDDLFEKRAEIDPEIYAECLHRFDVQQGFHHGWDHMVLDPWASTFMEKQAEVVWEQGADRVTAQQLHNLAMNHAGGMQEKFTQDFLGEFEKDPVGIFKSMPDPQKRILARLAADMVSQGQSEGQVPITADSSVDPKKEAL